MPEAVPGSEEHVLAFLAEAPDEFVPGEAISDKLGLSRAAVWKHVNALRGQGYGIQAQPARGYRLVSIPDRLGELEIAPRLNTHDVGRTLHCAEELPSTNDRARELADEGASHGETVVAESQTAGRGRRGRAWASPPGLNLYLSVVLRPSLPPQRVAELTLVASVAACEACRKAGVDAGIKWPHDLLVEGRKVAGILTELSAEPDMVHWVVIGIGVNLNARREDLPTELRDVATSLSIERGQPVPRALFAAALLSELEQWMDLHAAEGFAPVREAWKKRSVTLGREVRVEVDGQAMTGVAEDIDATGALLVRGRSGVVRVLSGDVHLGPAR
jgi:BirA family biotin operon repressor/biotin-[acetyl-CoA-carboxylase] ligase